MGRIGIGLWVAALAVGALASVAIAAGSHGSARADRLVGTKAGDELKGLRGHDVLIGGRGVGRADRRARAPTSSAEARAATASTCATACVLAAPGRDTIDARDGRNDEINCGGGNDVAIVDSIEDGVYDCEVVREPAP